MGAMTTWRGRWQFLALLALSMPLFGGAAASARERDVSPSQVLGRVDATLGAQNVNFRPRPETAGESGDDKTLAPYFYVDGGDAETDRLPLKETSADVQIAGVIARVRVHQVFENSGSKPIEAVYVFPGSTRAAVHGMRMRIGERTIEAKIDKKQAAREQYEQAKQQGKRASLLEQQRPNVFTMNVANVMPRDRIEVELDYSELLVPEDAVYEFVFPTVVGPRYGGGADPVKDSWISNPYLTEGKPEPYRFDLKAHLETGIAIKDLTSPSHKVTVSYLSPSSADVQLQQPGGGNKDFVLRYRLAGDRIETGLLLLEGERGENFFVMMMEPPQRPALKQIPPREYIFLLDVSGSMHGFPLDTAKELMRNLLGQLRSTDYFNMAFFSGGAYVLNPDGSLPATASNIQMATERIGQLQGGGGTELMGGLRTAYAIPKRLENVSRSVIVVTDGYVGVEAQAFKFVREHLNEANLFAFGIGSSVNRGLIEGMARAGQGEPFVVLRPERASEESKKLRDYVEQPVLSNIQFSFDGFDAVEVAPAKLPDLMARRPLVLFGKYHGQPRGTVTVRGFSGGGAIVQTLAVEPKAVKPENAPIRWLWARKWVELLDDERALSPAKEIEEAITGLGLSYNLLTSFTSFVAIDSEIANRGGQVETVKQALPLPEGVSNYAVGGNVAMSKSARMLQAPAAPAPAAEAQAFGAGGMGAATADSFSAAAAPVMRRKLEVREEEKAAKKDRDASEKLTLRIVESAGLTDVAPLLKQIRLRLSSQVCSTCLTAPGLFKLRFTVDSVGRVVGVEVVSASDAGRGKCLVKAMQSLASESRASGPIGALVVEVLVP